MVKCKRRAQAQLRQELLSACPTEGGASGRSKCRPGPGTGPAQPSTGSSSGHGAKGPGAGPCLPHTGAESPAAFPLPGRAVGLCSTPQPWQAQGEEQAQGGTRARQAGSRLPSPRRRSSVTQLATPSPRTREAGVLPPRPQAYCPPLQVPHGARWSQPQNKTSVPWASCHPMPLGPRFTPLLPLSCGSGRGQPRTPMGQMSCVSPPRSPGLEPGNSLPNAASGAPPSSSTRSLGSDGARALCTCWGLPRNQTSRGLESAAETIYW